MSDDMRFNDDCFACKNITVSFDGVTKTYDESSSVGDALADFPQLAQQWPILRRFKSFTVQRACSLLNTDMAGLQRIIDDKLSAR